MKDNVIDVINVDASVSKEFKPDLIKINITFEDELDSKEDCITQFNTDLNAVLDSIIDTGIDKSTIKQDGFSIFPHKERIYKKYDDEESSPSGYYYVTDMIKGYEYTANAKFEISTDSELFEKIWLALISTDGHFSFEFDYDLTNRAAAEKALLAEAVESARERAEILALASGVKLGAPHSINHSYRNLDSRYCMDAPSYGCHYGDSPMIPVPDFNPEDIEINCSIDISWHIA